MTVRVCAVDVIGQATGEASPNRTASRFAVYATDLGVLWDDGDDGVVVAFGDTYGAGWGGNGAGPPTADWRWNTLGRSTTSDLSRGLLLDDMVEDRPGHAGEIIPRDPAVAEHTVIPTSGIADGGRQYLHYMSVRWWGRLTWRTNHGGIAYSDDGGQTWVRDPAARWVNTPRGRHPFQLGGFARHGAWVYLFGTPNGRRGAISLARVAPADVGDPAAYRYWTGSAWSPRVGQAVPVADGPAGELSAAYHGGLDRWLLVHLDEPRARIVLRSAPEPTGPWSDGEVLVTGAEHPGLYGGFLHPWALDGSEICFTMSQWGPYAVYLLRARLERYPPRDPR